MKNDEDKISMALHRINLEDPTFEIKRNKETAQLLLGGQGTTHLNYVLERMKTIFKVDVDVEEQKIVYRETIKKSVQAEGKHKKQSGGAGQFGHVWIRFEPSKEIFEFEEDVFGGAVPKNYLIPLILFFSITGIYVMSFNNFDIYLMIGIAVVATFMRLYDFPMPPLILAFVLGGLMEENLRRSLLLSDGSWTFLWDRTLTACILVTTILIVGWQIYKTITKKN